MNVLKIKVKTSISLGGRVYPKDTVIYIDEYTGMSNQSTYNIYNLKGKIIGKTTISPKHGGELMQFLEIVSEDKSMDQQLEGLIEASDGKWVEDEFRINGAGLMNLLREASKL